MKLTYGYIPTNIVDGTKSVGTAGTRVQISSAFTPCISIALTANSANSGIICVGGTAVVATSASRTGVPLAAGDSLILEFDNLNKIYLDSTVSGEGVSYFYKN